MLTRPVDKLFLLSSLFTATGVFSKSITLWLRLPMAESTFRSLMSFNFWLVTTVLFSSSKAAWNIWLSWNIKPRDVGLLDFCSTTTWWLTQFNQAHFRLPHHGNTGNIQEKLPQSYSSFQSLTEIFLKANLFVANAINSAMPANTQSLFISSSRASLVTAPIISPQKSRY